MAATNGTKRIILEMGKGTDLHGGYRYPAGGDPRGAQDAALHHSSLTFRVRSGLDLKQTVVEVTEKAQQPDKVDAASVKATLRARPGHGKRRQGRARASRAG